MKFLVGSALWVVGTFIGILAFIMTLGTLFEFSAPGLVYSIGFVGATLLCFSLGAYLRKQQS
jgi:Na+(H+)/acetate symporter ActP